MAKPKQVAAKPKPQAKPKVKAKPAKAAPQLDDLSRDTLDELDIDDAAAFARVCDEATRQFTRDDHDTDTLWLYALARFARSKRHGDRARELLLGGFDRLIEVKTKRDRLINSVAYHAIPFAALDMPPHPSIGPALHQAFRVAAELTKLEVHFNMNVTCGPLAIALVTLDYRDVIEDLARFREKFDHYDGTPFHTQVLYAQWMFTNDAAGARMYLAKSDQLKCLGWAAAALADLDHKPGQKTIATRLAGTLHAESREALLEASTRLAKQRKPPAIADRMIWLYGRVSPVEIALGYETDNEFRHRAVAKRAAATGSRTR